MSPKLLLQLIARDQYVFSACCWGKYVKGINQKINERSFNRLMQLESKNQCVFLLPLFAVVVVVVVVVAVVVGNMDLRQQLSPEEK